MEVMLRLFGNIAVALLFPSPVVVIPDVVKDVFILLEPLSKRMRVTNCPVDTQRFGLEVYGS